MEITHQQSAIRDAVRTMLRIFQRRVKGQIHGKLSIFEHLTNKEVCDLDKWLERKSRILLTYFFEPFEPQTQFLNNRQIMESGPGVTKNAWANGKFEKADIDKSHKSLIASQKLGKRRQNRPYCSSIGHCLTAHTAQSSQTEGKDL